MVVVQGVGQDLCRSQGTFSQQSYGVSMCQRPRLERLWVPHPSRTCLMSEWPIHWSYSWHKSKTGNKDISYKDALCNVSMVDGHAQYIKIYYNPSLPNGDAPFAYRTADIPESYGYQNAPD